MNCPGCGTWIPSSDPTCSQCRLDLTALRTIGELRGAVSEARVDAHHLARRIRDIEDQVEALPPLVASQLELLAHALPEDEEARPSTGVSPSAQTIEPPASALPDGDVHVDLQPAALPTFSTAGVSAPTDPLFDERSELQLGQKWLLIVGVVITVLAVGFFLKYSFDRNWIGPTGRLMLAYAAGVAMLGIGEALRHRGYDRFGLYLIGGAIAVLYFACYAGSQIYHLFDRPVAFTLMVVITFFAGILSLCYNTKWLAVLGIIGGFLTPIVIPSSSDNQIALMTYMTILNAGILAIAAFKRWNLLNGLGLACTWLLFSVWCLQHYVSAKFWPTIVFLNIFFLAYAAVPFVYHFVRQTREPVIGFALTFPNTAIALVYSYVMIHNRYSQQAVGIVTIAYALLFLGMAAYLYHHRRQSRDAFALLMAKGAFFLVLTVPVVFSAHWITVFWAAQGIVLLWAARQLDDSRFTNGAIGLLALATAKLFLYDYYEIFDLRLPAIAFGPEYSARLVERWLTSGLCLGALFTAGWMLREDGYTGRDARPNYAGPFFGTFGALLFLALNLEVAGFFHDVAPRARIAAISVCWAVFAAVLMALGFVRDQRLQRRLAIGLFGATVVKVLIRDTADVDTPFRILSFLIVGLLLVGASFLYHRFANRILPVGENDDPELEQL